MCLLAQSSHSRPTVSLPACLLATSPQLPVGRPLCRFWPLHSPVLRTAPGREVFAEGMDKRRERREYSRREKCPFCGQITREFLKHACAQKKKKKKSQGIFTLCVRRQKQAMCAGMGPGWTAPASFWLMISEIVREEEELKRTQQAQSRWDFTEFWLFRSWRSMLRVGGALGFCGWTGWHTQGLSLGNMET